MLPVVMLLSNDPRTRRPLLPTRVLWHSLSTENSEILLHNDWGQALAQNVPCCIMKGTEASVLLDFGRELNGSLQLVSGPTAGNRVAHLRVRFGESASEAMGQPNNDHTGHDFEIGLSPMASQEFGLSGFRFARLDLLDDLELPLVCARAVTLEYEGEKVGSFSCSDQRLNDIWHVGAETVRLCLQDYIWDGIKRDRLVWMGDLHPEIAVVLRVWGALPIVPRSLDWVRDHTPLPEWMNGIGSYSMWWVILQHDWLLHSGDSAYLEEQRAYLCGLLPELLKQVSADGTITWRGSTFLDWPSSPNKAAVLNGLHALLALALENGAHLCEALQENELAQQCREGRIWLQKTVPALADANAAGIAGNKQAAALLSLAKLADTQQANEQVLACEPLRGLSAFYGYYVLQARANAGDTTGALEALRRYWGAMLDLGATSFWEDFNLDWTQNAGRIDELPTPEKVDIHREYGAYCYKGLRHSFCHGWAAGPTAFLSQYVLGVHVLENGCKRVAIKPDLGDLQWAEGTFPTPYGPIHIRHEREANGQIKTHIQAPQEIHIEQ